MSRLALCVVVFVDRKGFVSDFGMTGGLEVLIWLGLVED
jgi:hypothetical protein